jgi:FkbM family methyltransferase
VYDENIDICINIKNNTICTGVPIVIICYNNYKYVANTIEQIKKINRMYVNFIKIMDNCSTDQDTIDYLKKLETEPNISIIWNKTNDGPWITSTINASVYHNLPNRFILTDPDLEFNPMMPSNFIDVMINLSNKYQCKKIGCALDISDYDLMYQTQNYVQGMSIQELESRYWLTKMNDSEYELYNYGIDTTMCLINKSYFESNKIEIRIAGNFTAKHLPWYIDNKIYNVYENYQANIKPSSISTISSTISEYIKSNYLMINKNDEILFIKDDSNNNNLHFWKHIFSHWEHDTFKVFDTFLNKNSVWIDIGGWIGTTCIYGSRKSKHTYSIEADKCAFEDMKANCYINSRNCTLINKAILNVNDIDVTFGKNKFLHGSKLSDSTSQIYTNESNENKTDDCYTIKTITLDNMISTYSIDPTNIALIKVDIEGGEENILNDLYNLHKMYKTPLYVSFHYSWWKDKNIERFEFLSHNQIETVRANPFVSLLFN